MDCTNFLHAGDFAFTGNYFLQITYGRALSPVAHRHDFYEIILALSGECRHVINGEEQIFGAGSFTVCRPGDVHFFISQKPDTNIMALSVKQEEMNEFIGVFSLDTADLVKIIQIPPNECQKMETLGLSMLSKPFDKDLFKFFMSIIISKLLENRAQFSPTVPPEFQCLLTEMSKLENAAKGVGAFAEIAQYSHSQLWRLTKKYLGVSPSEYVNNIRMKYAYDMIAFGNRSFEEIASDVGFSSFSHFISLVKKNFGMTPAAIRKSVQKH